MIGHVTRDLLHNNANLPAYTLGGTVSFAAVTARKLGYSPAVVTRAAADVDLTELAQQADLTVLPSSVTTTFDNIYSQQGRIQYVYTPAPPIAAADLPARLCHPRIALLGPLVHEVTPDLAACFSAEETLVAAVPQGWMRRWDSDGLVHPIHWESADAILPHLNVLILSIEDIGGDLAEIDRFLTLVPLVVMTQYRRGCTIYQRRKDGVVRVVQVPPRPAREVDPTGAGDIFATAFLLRLRQTGDPLRAARYANVTASFGVEGLGVTGIPTHEQVIDYMDRHPWTWQGKEVV